MTTIATCTQCDSVTINPSSDTCACSAKFDSYVDVETVDDEALDEIVKRLVDENKRQSH